jgi:hypothetical protein
MMSSGINSKYLLEVKSSIRKQSETESEGFNITFNILILLN